MMRWNPYEHILNVHNVATLSMKWRRSLEVGDSSPAVANGVVYVTSGYGYVYALKASTGAVLWNYSTGDDVQTSPAVANGVVYFGGYYNGYASTVYALNAATGALLWTYTIGPYTYSSPTVANGVVYVGGGQDNTVYALDANAGTLLWSYTTGGQWHGLCVFG
jgi:eukaryotic-like serine/threonine-protein kinase